MAQWSYRVAMRQPSCASDVPDIKSLSQENVLTMHTGYAVKSSPVNIKAMSLLTWAKLLNRHSLNIPIRWSPVVYRVLLIKCEVLKSSHINMDERSNFCLI